MDVQPRGKRMWLKPSSDLAVHSASLTDPGNPEAGVLDLFKYTCDTQLWPIIKAVFFNTWTESTLKLICVC